MNEKAPWTGFSLVMLCLSILAAVAPGVFAGGARASLKTETGVVERIDRVPGEGGIEVVRVILAPEGDRDAPLGVLLAPPEALDAIGFRVEEGDRLRVKLFVNGDDDRRAHKVKNESRGVMVRLRTLAQVPMWDNHGRWQGGPGRTHAGHGGGRGGRR